MTVMSTKLIAFRCPVELMQRVDAVAAALGTTRSSLVVAAVRLLAEEVRGRNGRLVPSYSGDDILERLEFGERGDEEFYVTELVRKPYTRTML